MASEDFLLNIWRLHPKSVRLQAAESTLNGTANPDGVRWCKPYATANAAGFWLFPPIDIDILWKGDREFEYRFHEQWPASDHDLVQSLVNPTQPYNVEMFCPRDGGRSKASFGTVDPAVVQMWTGCIFETPPGWCLHIRPPVNTPFPGYRVMEGILETDWLQYDIWTNIVFEEKGRWIEFRKNQWPPLAQLIPMKRESVMHEWKTGTDEFLNRETPAGNRVTDFWLEYNHRKFGMGGKQPLSKDRTKDSATYHKVRAEVMGKQLGAVEPLPDKIKPKPLPKKIKIANRFINTRQQRP